MTTKTEGTMDKEGRYTAGAMKAAQAIEREQQRYDRGSFPLKNHIVCEIISRETHDQEMAVLLRRVVESLDVPNGLRNDAELLLTRIGETP